MSLITITTKSFGSQAPLCLQVEYQTLGSMFSGLWTLGRADVPHFLQDPKVHRNQI